MVVVRVASFDEGYSISRGDLLVSGRWLRSLLVSLKFESSLSIHPRTPLLSCTGGRIWTDAWTVLVLLPSIYHLNDSTPLSFSRELLVRIYFGIVRPGCQELQGDCFFFYGADEVRMSRFHVGTPYCTWSRTTSHHTTSVIFVVQETCNTAMTTYMLLGEPIWWKPPTLIFLESKSKVIIIYHHIS